MVKRQFGIFLIMIGILLLALFVFSYIANQMNFWLFLGGVGILVWGGHTLVTNPGQPRPKAERFRMVKKISTRKKKEDKKEKKDKQDKQENEES